MPYDNYENGLANGSDPRIVTAPHLLESRLLLSLTELAEVLGHRVGIAGRNTVAGAAPNLPGFGFARLTPQLHFQRLELGQNLAADARVQFRGSRLAHLQTRQLAAEILNLASQVGVVPVLLAQI